MTSFMLAKEYTKDMKIPKALKDNVPPIGWLLSEKFDGYRARWIPERRMFLSRNQKEFIAPDWFKDAMPDVDPAVGRAINGAGFSNISVLASQFLTGGGAGGIIGGLISGGAGGEGPW